MHYIPIKTRTFIPPQDNLFTVLDESLTDVQEGDVIVVTSKVVSIHEGRCVPMEGTDKSELVRREAEYIFNPEDRVHPLTITHHALISAAGIDESNSSGYYTLLPEKPFESAQEIYQYLRKRFNREHLGVIITDSHSLLFRYGAMSVSIGYWGFVPVESHVGRADLFGRLMKFSSTNIVDSISAGCALVTGECDESQPVVIVRNVPNVVFTDVDVREKLLIPFEEDIYKSLFKDFKKLK